MHAPSRPLASLSGGLLACLTGLLAAAPLAATGRPGGDRLDVVTTIPDLADIVQQIGGARVSVTSITRGGENLHAVSARPSHLVALSRADVFVQVGLSLEAVFVPGLLQGARNRAIQPGGPGFVSVSEGWTAIDVPDSLSREGGDLHPHGNPHLNLDPRGGEHAARVVLEALVRIAPDGAEEFRERHMAYAERLARARARWDELGKGLRGRSVAVYHQEFNYLAAYHGLPIAASIELRPGVPPSPGHLAEVVATMKREGVRVILVAPWARNRDVERVAEATGARIVVLPNQAGATEATRTWIGMMDHIHRTLAAAFGDQEE